MLRLLKSDRLSRCHIFKHREEVNVPTLCTFTFLGCWLLPLLLHVTTSPLHPLPAAEHVIILICGDLLWILILRKDACEEIQDETE